MAADAVYDFFVDIDTSIYSTDVVMRAAYRLTDRFYVFLERTSDCAVRVALSRKRANVTLGDPRGELANLLVDEAVRQSVRRETSAARDVIIRTALAEALPHGK